MMRKVLLATFVVLLFTLLGARISSNLLQIGKKVEEDITIEFDRGGATPPAIKWDETTDKLQFSNDGTSFIDIGSGSGGAGSSENINLLASSNFDFEGGTSDWTAFGGGSEVFTTATGGSQLFGTFSGSFDGAAAADGVRSADVPVESGIEGAACLAEFYFEYSGTSGDYVARVELDDGTAITQDVDLGAVKSKAQLGFVCPTNDSIRLVVEATTDGGVILLDQAYLGRDFRLSPFNDSAELIAKTHYNGTTNCNWQRTSASFGDLSDVDCPAATVDFEQSFTVDVADNNAPDIVFDNLPAGRYVVTAQFVGIMDSANQNGNFRLSDGTTNSGLVHIRGDGTFHHEGVTLIGVFEYTDAAARTFKIQSRASSGQIQISNDVSGYRELHFVVERLPLTSSADQVTLDTQGWYVSAVISGANIVYSATQAYTPISSSILTMSLEDGSADAKIPCTGGNAPTGLTCSTGNEVIGASFDIPKAGAYAVCWHGTTGARILDAAGNQDTEYNVKLGYTSETSDTIIANGQTRSSHRLRMADGTDDNLISNRDMGGCDIFNWSSAGTKTVRNYLEIDAISTPINGILTSGEPQYSIKVFPITQNFPQAVALTPITRDYSRVNVSGDTTLDGTFKDIATTTAGDDGVYFCQCNIQFVPSGTFLSQTQLALNGSVQTGNGPWMFEVIEGAANDNKTVGYGGIVINVTEGDTLACQAKRFSGSGITRSDGNGRSNISCFKISD